MDALELLGLSAGIGFLSGIRLYATVLAVGLAIRFHWLEFASDQAQWSVLAHPWVLIVAGTAAAIELVADKIAWLDSVWDGFHTIVRPVGALLLGAAAFGSVDPKLRVILILLCGGMALTSHTSKAATRIMANHSPEPFSNMAISAAEDVFQVGGLWLLMQHPLILSAIVAVFLVAFFWLFRKIVRVLRRRFGSGVPQPVA
jgi:hypothetical protein